MDTTIQVILKDVYGKTKAYPHNAQAKRLAELDNLLGGDDGQ